MNNKMYKLMNWPEIEAICYAESDRPSEILGPHTVGASTLYQAFIPGAKEVRIRFPEEDKSIKMEQVDELGFFAFLRTGKNNLDYVYIAEYPDGKMAKFVDAYKFKPQISKNELAKYAAGELTDAYKVLGAVLTTIDGVSGTRFAIWAPNARRVSVVGPFNNWDGRINPMNRHEGSGVFELFIPDVSNGTQYMYEVNMKGGRCKCVLDPFALETVHTKDGYKSVVSDEKNIVLTSDRLTAKKDTCVSIFECNLSKYASLGNYEEIAKCIAPKAKEMGYTHIELMPVAEYCDDESNGFDTIMYFAPTSRFGTPSDFAKMVDIIHANDLKLIVDWAVAHPSSKEGALRKLDGTACYEHEDNRQGIHPEWGSLLFNYARGEVLSFLKSNARYWIDRYHIDGYRIDSLASILCLDYGRNNGEWIPNIYGGHENLDAVEFLKSTNHLLKKEFPGVITIAEDSSAWPKVTSDVSDDGLGFDYKWNIGWREDYLRYISLDPLFRQGSHNDLSLSMLYCYSDKFILPVSAECGNLIDKYPGDKNAKLANARLSLSYMISHPGAKLVYDDYDKYDCAKDGISKLMKTLNGLYASKTALHELDAEEDGFEWINNMDSEKSVLTFIRKGKTENDFLVVAANFAGIEQKVEIGVSVPGKYNRILNSEWTTFGGKAKIKEDKIYSIDSEADGRPYHIDVMLPALSLSIFEYGKFDDSDRDYMQKMHEEAKHKANEALAQAAEEEEKAKKAEKKAEAEQKKAEEAAKAAEIARIKAEKEYAKAIEEMEKAREAMEIAKEAAKKAEVAAHRLKLTEDSMK